MEYITICNLVMDCDKKLLKGGLTNPVACGLRQTVAENRWRDAGSLRASACVLPPHAKGCGFWRLRSSA